jgi:hypothetical protein
MPAIRNVIISGVYAVVLAAPAAADPLPASVRSCIGEADATRRLACYDREVARLIAPAGTFAPATTPVAAASPPLPAAAAAPRHLSAKVSAVRQSGDSLIVTLDNGDVWEQSAPATSQLNVRSGDVVQVDHELGGWFLSNRYGDNIQVRLRQP